MIDIIRRYAEVIIRKGVNVQKNQPVRIITEVVNSRFIRVLAEEAYRAGAAYVYVEYSDGPLERIRLDFTENVNNLTFLPSWSIKKQEALLDENWAAVSLRGPEDPDILEGVNVPRLGTLKKAEAAGRKLFSAGIASNKIPWNVCLWPTKGWAEKVLEGKFDDWEKRIWDVLVPILRLDQDDPATAWTECDIELKRRASYMNSREYTGIHFTGPGIDLFIGLGNGRIWAGGSGSSRSGIKFFPNIPTEEIFCTPDRPQTSGVVRCTRPVTVLGAQVEGAWFRFENGAVVESGAETNEGVLTQYLITDDGSRYLGEIALVGIDSPIYRSGRVFHNILFDENASCHIALGNGYTDCISGGSRMKKEELKAVGCNYSLVHIDFMIGSEEVSVFGVDRSGGEEPIMRNGLFVI